MCVHVHLCRWGLKFHTCDLPQYHTRFFLRWVLTWCPPIRLDRLDSKPHGYVIYSYTWLFMCVLRFQIQGLMCVVYMASALQTKLFPHPYAFNLCAKPPWDNYYYLHFRGGTRYQVFYLCSSSWQAEVLAVPKRDCPGIWTHLRVCVNSPI